MTNFHPMMQDAEQGFNAMTEEQIDGRTLRFRIAVAINFISVGLLNALV